MNAFSGRVLSSLTSDRVYAVWSGSELTVTFSARPDRSDYGVPGSPVWDEVVDIEIDTVTLLGITLDPSALPAQLRNAIKALSEDLTEWSPA